MKITFTSVTQKVLFVLAFSTMILPVSAQDQIQWKEINTVEDVCATFHDRMRTMLQTYNLEYDGLEKVKQAYESDDIPLACSALLDYYKNGNSAQYLRMNQPPVSQKTTSNADSIVQDIFTFQLVTGKVPRLEKSQLNWFHNGPEDDIEWAWALNRHYPIRDLLRIYFETGNPEYARYIDSFIKDWIIESLPYPAVKSNTAMWRGLEVSFRVKIWAKVFYGLMNTDYTSPATQLLILSSLSEHAHYARKFHAQNNWLTMEITGLATVATAWKELMDATEWLEYSKETMVESMKGQVYPDGVQTELTSSYHYVALANFMLFDQICKNANERLPDYFNETMEEMYDYLAYTMRPDGFGILNNDADRKSNREWIFKAFDKYNREDWRYIATNGEKGIKPNGEPSVIYPWAGHLVSRNGYDKNAHWSFFDIGPWGSGHQHNDKLHISISAFGRDLLVDGGRFAYRGEVARKFRGYAKGSQSHNVILIDGKGQSPGPKVIDQPLSEIHFKIASDYDYAWNSFDQFNDVDGEIKHTRSMMYVRDNFWIVVDNIETSIPRKIETLWHWHPECEVEEINKNAVSTKNEKGNLQIIPIGKGKWDIMQVKGQENPEIQGWYSPEYNNFEPNVTSIYSTNIKSDETFIWLLVPFQSSVPKVKAKVIAKDDEGVKLRIVNPAEGEWNLSIPYSDSQKVKLIFKEASK